MPSPSRRMGALGFAGVVLVAGLPVASASAGPVVRAPACFPDQLDPAASRLAIAPHPDVGRLVWGTLPGPVLDGPTTALLVHRDLGGLVLFGANIRTSAQLRALDAAIHRAGSTRAIISTDQEGGLVRRIPFAGPGPSEADQSRRGPAGVRALFSAAGRQLRALGIDVDLAPVADLATPGDFEGSRAFRGPSGAVADLVAGAVTGLRSAGVLPTVKHFPGLAGVRRSTDDGRQAARPVGGVDLVPFRAAIRAGTPVVMIDLARHPGLGPRPAALSEKTYALLRHGLGFHGVAMTDALTAGAARAAGSETADAVAAMCAGADVVLAPGGPRAAGEVIDALAGAVRSGRLPRSRVAAALERVAALSIGS